MCAVAVEKRERCPNFTSKEEGILLSLVEQHRAIIENKKTDAAMCNQKRRVWEEICADFELHSGQPRSLKNLRDKYENLKKKTRKELAEGGANISSTTERLAMLMQITSTTGAAGMKNEFDGGDGDYVDNNQQKSSASSDHSDQNKQLLNFLDVVIKSENVETGEEEQVEQAALERPDHENVPDKSIYQDNELGNFSSWASWKPNAAEFKNSSSKNHTNNHNSNKSEKLKTPSEPRRKELSNFSSWASWKPNAAELKNSSSSKNHTNNHNSNKSEKLKTPSEPRRKVKKGHPDVYKYSEKNRLLQAQRKFFENEDKRADEKQRWERDQAAIKLKILEMELEIKKEELKRKQKE